MLQRRVGANAKEAERYSDPVPGGSSRPAEICIHILPPGASRNQEGVRAEGQVLVLLKHNRLPQHSAASELANPPLQINKTQGGLTKKAGQKVGLQKVHFSHILQP